MPVRFKSTRCQRDTPVSDIAAPRISRPAPGAVVIAAVLSLGVLVAGCSAPKSRAPVESRSISKAGAVPPRAATTSAAPVVPVPDGFYRIRRGDTLIGISLDHGVAWRDLATWNQIENPNVIEVDQLIRIRPPSGTSLASAPRTAPESKSATEVRPLTGAKPLQNPPPAPPANTASVAKAAESINLSWPAQGQVITQFADPGYKGIALAGTEGDPIVAAGDGRVVYSGNGLRGYGNLVIVKHDGDFLTAYAHNKTILVAEGQSVKRGQKIAELGKTDSDIPKLHFEVRRSGKPVDPLKFLAQR